MLMYPISVRLMLVTNFEHFDERLDRWERESLSHSYIDRNISAPDVFGTGFSSIDWFRHFDSQTATALFWGDTFDLHALVQGAADLLPIATAEAEELPWPEPPE